VNLHCATETFIKALSLLENTFHQFALQLACAKWTMQHGLHVQIVFLLATLRCHDDVFRDTQLLHEVQTSLQFSISTSVTTPPRTDSVKERIRRMSLPMSDRALRSSIIAACTSSSVSTVLNDTWLL
jgi:hypothetical protein